MKAKQVWIAAALFVAGAAQAQVSGGVVKIGVLNDMSSLYAEGAGQGSVVAARMAIEDFGRTAEAKGLKVELVFADNQNKADVGSSIARQWFDTEGVDAVLGTGNSAVGLAVNELAREKGKTFLATAVATSDLTGKACSPNTVHWAHDTWMLSNSTARAVVQTGGDSWFFLTADYSFGHALERDASAVVQQQGGRIAGSVRHPLNTADFSSFLLQAVGSKAKIIGLANAGNDTITAIKQGAEFGVQAGGQQFAGLLVFITDVHALGLQQAQGLLLTETFYWDTNEQTRAFAKRYGAAYGGRFPNMIHAASYSATLHYLKAIAAADTDDGTKVVAKMKELPVDDPLHGKGRIRADGRVVTPAYLFEVKKPEESKHAGDYYKLRATVPGDEAFRPEPEGGCALVKN